MRLGAGGALSFFSQSGGHLLADVTGSFVAAPASSVKAPSTTVSTATARSGLTLRGPR